LHPSGVSKLITSFGWGKGGKVAAAGWKVTLCDPVWHVISLRGVTISIMIYELLLSDLLYLFTIVVCDGGHMPLLSVPKRKMIFNIFYALFITTIIGAAKRVQFCRLSIHYQAESLILSRAESAISLLKPGAGSHCPQCIYR